ncbi:transposase [Escherichia coli]|uniref:transposase n=1 Tax=Escherichia coli TaxID=562 RepID=UPI000D59B915|nr:transposase [Escherichia coli]
MSRSAKPRKRKPAPQRSKLPRYVVKLHDDDFFDEEDAEALRFDNFDDAVECCADLNIPFFVDAGNKKLVFLARFTGRTESPRPSDASPFCRHFSAGKPLA